MFQSFCVFQVETFNLLPHFRMTTVGSRMVFLMFVKSKPILSDFQQQAPSPGTNDLVLYHQTNIRPADRWLLYRFEFVLSRCSSNNNYYQEMVSIIIDKSFLFI